ncbi:K(+)/H(+) antiporter NhaP2 [Halalkalicoccus paucihalophilus]|uniref:K(+)/H(+) antiporter NhaP2 n=1 Tax=Halalkalicoccus paucihalophilus TaxID=1008153 RepID=A0A151A9D0_9EURY|nr:sodium:proton antiporter [Halalkalicoccus paucihalophilus]KYH24213.1 K(+)/H(+) antiporter NhaP2 [Halalkalicoccus paucihalophilus]
MVGLEEQLITLLYLFAIAAVVGIVSARYSLIEYTTGLISAGILISVVGSPIEVELTSDFILLVLLPVLIFNEAVNIDPRAFRENLVPILMLAVPGLLVSIAIIAVASRFLFGFPLVIAVLFGVIIMPTDPVSVLATFDNLGVPERLSILVEGESLLNDGVSIVVYSSVLGIILEAESAGVATGELLTRGDLLFDIGIGITVAIIGGALVGAGAGYVASKLIAFADDSLTSIVVSVVLAYGVYLFLDVLGTSGVIGTLTAGIFLVSPRVTEFSPTAHFTLENIWEYLAVLANTLIFVTIGIVTPIDLNVEFAGQVVAAIVVVFLARAIVIYPLVELLNRQLADPIPRSYQHVLTWSGIHASVSIALILGVSETGAFADPLVAQLSAMVFGVAAFTLLVNGPTMGRLLDRVGIGQQTSPQRLYESLIGRMHGVDAALDTAERLRERDEISESIFEDVTAIYRRERAELEAAIESLLDQYPDIRRHEERLETRRILTAEHEAIHEAIQRGEISKDVGERLLDDVKVELDRTLTDEWTVPEPTPTGFTPYWRQQLETVRPENVGEGIETDTSRSDDGSEPADR